MTRYTILALCLALPLMAPTAHADGERFSLFKCGLRLGGDSGSELTFTGREEQQVFESPATPERFGPRQTSMDALAPSPVQPRKRERKPEEYTFAKFVCSW